MCKTESSWEAAVQPRSSAQGPVMASRGGTRGGRETQEGADVYTYSWFTLL